MLVIYYIGREKNEQKVYLDKDTLIPLSKRIFEVAGQPYDRSSQFFEENIRNYEYDCIVVSGKLLSIVLGN